MRNMDENGTNRDKKTLANSVYYKIRDAIMTGELSSNELILEQNVADHYGISKITAREVLQRLCHDKYLKSFPRKGYLILDITPAQLNMIQKVRYQIEALALREVIRHATDEEISQLEETLKTASPSQSDPYETVNSRFHLQIAKLSKNTYLYDTLYGFIGLVCRYAMTNGMAVVTQKGQPHHDQILAALRQRNIPVALEELRLDLQLEPDEI